MVLPGTPEGVMAHREVETNTRGTAVKDEVETDEQEAVKVSVGNPYIEVIKGVVHLYKETAVTAPARREHLPVRP